MNSKKVRSFVDESLTGSQPVNRTGVDVERNGIEAPFAQISRQPAISGTCIESDPSRNISYRRLQCAKRPLPNVPDVGMPFRMKWKVEIVTAPLFTPADAFICFKERLLGC